MHATDPMVEAKLAQADELPAVVVSAMKMAYASRQRMVERFTENLEQLLKFQDTASQYRATIQRDTRHARLGLSSDADIALLEEIQTRATYAEQARDAALEQFIKTYAAENRMEVRF